MYVVAIYDWICHKARTLDEFDLLAYYIGNNAILLGAEIEA